MSTPKIKVLSNGPLKPVLPGLVDKFQLDSGVTVQLEFSPGPVIADRVRSGEAADVLIVPPDENRALIEAGILLPEHSEVVARIGIGIFLRDDVVASDISSPAAFQHAILAADPVIHVNVGSGLVFGDLLKCLGITEIMKNKIVCVGTGFLLDGVLNGTGNDMGAAPMSRILDPAVTGLKLVGPLPAEYQFYSVLSASVTAAAPAPDAAKQFIKFLMSPASRSAIAAVGAL